LALSLLGITYIFGACYWRWDSLINCCHEPHRDILSFSLTSDVSSNCFIELDVLVSSTSLIISYNATSYAPS